MASADTSVEAQLAALREEYARKLPERLSEIEALWQALGHEGWGGETAQSLHRACHTIAGSAGTFGLPKVGHYARVLERILKPLVQAAQKPDPRQTQALQQGLGTLRQQIEGINPDTATGAPSTCEAGVVAPRLAALGLGAELAEQLRIAGYAVESFTDVAALHSAAADGAAGFIVDCSLDSTVLDSLLDPSLDWLQHLGQRAFVVLAAHDDLAARIAAVRCGADGFLAHPVDSDVLLMQLDRLLARDNSDPYRVLVVDDEAALAQHYALVLRGAGMQAVTLCEPMRLMETLADFSPELILMDVYMPQCSGLELAKVLRQQDGCFNIPIVFLSSETNLDRQFAALRMGGDEFLTKPIADSHLVAAVRVRAERARALGALVVVDSLTGLLRHGALKEQLGTELVRARRSGSPVSFAMLDVDHFKQVNDSYGHPAGDRVLKSLARTLQQRVRKTDSVGRYGGEEFAVVLPEAKAEDALRLLDEVRQIFAQTEQQHGQTTFRVSLSGGVVEASGDDSVESVIAEADQALYRAKHQGRNRICLGGLN